MKYKILITDEFEEWLEEEPAKSRVQIAKRMENVREEGHFGDHKNGQSKDIRQAEKIYKDWVDD